MRTARVKTVNFMNDKVVEEKVNGDLVRLGQRIQQTRKLKGMTLEEVASRAQITKSLLSKIENYRAVPSLPVLFRIASSLELDTAELLRGFGRGTDPGYAVIRATDRTATERDDSYKFMYEALISRPVGNIFFDAQLLTIYPDSKRRAVTTEGLEFLFIVEGRIEYILDQERLILNKGDALFFDGRIPHVPICMDKRQAQILAIYLLQSPLED